MKYLPYAGLPTRNLAMTWEFVRSLALTNISSATDIGRIRRRSVSQLGTSNVDGDAEVNRQIEHIIIKS